MADEIKYSQFDQVRILTTKNVKYLSAPPGAKPNPNGLWSVAAAVDGDILLVRHGIIIRIPSTDVLKVVTYDLDAITSPLGKLTTWPKLQSQPPQPPKSPKA